MADKKKKSKPKTKTVTKVIEVAKKGGRRVAQKAKKIRIKSGKEMTSDVGSVVGMILINKLFESIKIAKKDKDGKPIKDSIDEEKTKQIRALVRGGAWLFNLQEMLPDSANKKYISANLLEGAIRDFISSNKELKEKMGDYLPLIQGVSDFNDDFNLPIEGNDDWDKLEIQGDDDIIEVQGTDINQDFLR